MGACKRIIIAAVAFLWLFGVMAGFVTRPTPAVAAGCTKTTNTQGLDVWNFAGNTRGGWAGKPGGASNYAKTLCEQAAEKHAATTTTVPGTTTTTTTLPQDDNDAVTSGRTGGVNTNSVKTTTGGTTGVNENSHNQASALPKAWIEAAGFIQKRGQTFAKFLVKVSPANTNRIYVRYKVTQSGGPVAKRAYLTYRGSSNYAEVDNGQGPIEVGVLEEVATEGRIWAQILPADETGGISYTLAKTSSRPDKVSIRVAATVTDDECAEGKEDIDEYDLPDVTVGKRTISPGTIEVDRCKDVTGNIAANAASKIVAKLLQHLPTDDSECLHASCFRQIRHYEAVYACFEARVADAIEHTINVVLVNAPGEIEWSDCVIPEDPAWPIISVAKEGNVDIGADEIVFKFPIQPDTWMMTIIESTQSRSAKVPTLGWVVLG